MAFADRLVAALKVCGFDVRIDRQDLPKLEDWKRELSHLIRQADTVILIVSKNSLASPIVAWEVEQVGLYGKRLAPIVISDVANLSVPSDVSRINYVSFTDPGQFDLNVEELAGALRIDLSWLKEHTRLGELALRWAERGKPGDTLIRGQEVTDAEIWSENHPRDMPPVTASQRAFLLASRRGELERLARETQQGKRRRTLISGLLVLIAGSLAYAGWTNRPVLRLQFAKMLDRLQQAALSPEAERALKPLQTFSECGECPVMIVIPAGMFTMGSPDSDADRKPEELPYHAVTISSAFAASEFEISFEQWNTCVALDGCTNQPPNLGFGTDTVPVINIDWDDARQYVAWLARRTGKPYRLLSEAEWEYAARANSETRYPWGDAIDQNNANCAKCGSQFDDQRTAPVGSFAPNAFGLHDMIGNVWEWVEDCWHENYQNAPSNGTAWIAGCADDGLRPVRGGRGTTTPLTCARPLGLASASAREQG
jgi:formylglycine-generating enzyme required for sulfatase activity